MKKIIQILLLLLVWQEASAQTEEPINTDRPDQSDGTYILTKNNFQIEDGLLFSKGSLLNNFMLRYGITKSTEARLLVDFGKTGDAKGVLPIGLSIKQRIVQQKNILPAITLVAYARYERLASRDFQSDNLSTSVLLAFQNDISDEISVGYNVGTSTFNKDLNFTVSIGYSFFKKVSFFTEYFSHFEHHIQPDHNIDLGVLYLINNKFQFDIAVGSSVPNTDKTQFLTAGFSYRI